MKTKIILGLIVATCCAVVAHARDRAMFLQGQYATEANCKKLRSIEAGTPKTIENAPELLTADGIKGWEGGCTFTKIFPHEPGVTWLALMICGEGMTVVPATYIFMKDEASDTFEVAGPNQEIPELYVRCDAKKGN